MDRPDGLERDPFAIAIAFYSAGIRRGRVVSVLPLPDAGQRRQGSQVLEKVFCRECTSYVV
jgi:hypothetical protein